MQTTYRITSGLMVMLLLWSAPTPAASKQPSVIEQANTLHQIRREKFDNVLPGAMRDNDIDMWIHVIRDGNPDPMQLHFGPVSGYIVFTDRGSGRI